MGLSWVVYTERWPHFVKLLIKLRMAQENICTKKEVVHLTFGRQRSRRERRYSMRKCNFSRLSQLAHLNVKKISRNEAIGGLEKIIIFCIVSSAKVRGRKGFERRRDVL